MTTPSYTITNESITLLFAGQPITLRHGSIQFQAAQAAIATALTTGNWDPVVDCIKPHNSLAQLLGTGWHIEPDGAIHYAGKLVPEAVRDRIYRLVEQGASVAPVIAFYQRLSRNPSWRSVQQLMGFLAHANIPLCEDGCFLAYKSVDANFLDHHSSTINNSPGQVHVMERNLVSDDPDQTCHFGFHVGALAYAQGFYAGSSAQLVICRIDPEHVVCVPNDYSYQKMRVCAYEVVGIYSGEPLTSDVHQEATSTVGDTSSAWAAYYANLRSTDDDDDGRIEDDEEEDDDVDLAEVVTPSPAAKRTTTPASTARAKARRFRRMDAAKLMAQSIEDLRNFAMHTLKLVGISRLPGGKTALVSLILKTQRKARR